MPSDSSESTDTSRAERACVVCAAVFSDGKHNKKYCSPDCQAEAARRRAAAWYAERRRDPDLRARVAEGSRRHHQRIKTDPDQYAAHLAATAAWRAANPEKVRESERAYWRANAARKREKDHRRRARLLSAFVEDVNIDVLWERDGGVCGICGALVDRDLAWPGRMVATIDHVVPLARGGEHSYANAQLAHMGCNARKGDRLST